MDATQSVQQGLSDLNKRVDTHTETVNKRLYDLEKHAFNGSDEGNGQQEQAISPGIPHWEARCGP